MPGEEELQKLEQSILNASRLMKKLVDEKEHWKSLYSELSGQEKMSKDVNMKNNNSEAFQQMEKLVQEVQTFRSKFELTLEQLNELKKKIYLRLNH